MKSVKTKLKNKSTTATAKEVQKTLQLYASKKRAETNAWFFKTGKGQYGEGDVFIGVSNPDGRKVALRYLTLPLSEVQLLLYSNIHEERFVALEILVAQYELCDKERNEKKKKALVSFYLKHKKQINNWDLVDTSASYILGHFLYSKKRDILYTLARSTSLWDRRISIIATHYFIRHGEYTETLALATLLLYDREDLMHKAVGWMLREVGKKDEKVLKKFLDTYASSMPRTMLRYAIERLSINDRARYMKK